MAETIEHPIRVALLTAPETTPAALYGLHEVLSAVGRPWPAATDPRSAVRRMEPVLVSRAGGPFVTTGGIPLPATVALRDTAAIDIAIVSDLDLETDLVLNGRWPAECEWLRRVLDGGALVCSVCTGAVLLAEAGLLDGVEATTHWAAAPIVAERYPAVRLRAERMLCASGPCDRIVTSGGSGAWTDLVLYLIARFCGTEEAMRISKIFVLGDHSDGQLPFAMMARPRRHDDAAIAHCQEWIAEHYAIANPVTAMITRSGLAPRTFKRRFREATGYTPLDYVQTLRIEEAKQMLETDARRIDEVAEAVGYRDPASFRRVFKRKAGVAPARYRQRFCALGRLCAPRREAAR